MPGEDDANLYLWLSKPGVQAGLQPTVDAGQQFTHHRRQPSASTTQTTARIVPQNFDATPSFAHGAPALMFDPVNSSVLKTKKSEKWSLFVAKDVLGEHSFKLIDQTVLSRNARHTFFFKRDISEVLQLRNAQALQIDNHELYGRGKFETYYFRTPNVKPEHIRAMLDISERSNEKGIWFPADLGRIRAVGGSPQFQRNFNEAVQKESNRRMDVVIDVIGGWQARIKDARQRALDCGDLVPDSPNDRNSQAKVGLINQIYDRIASDKLTHQQLSAVYRQFEPHGASAPLQTQPDWNVIARLVGLQPIGTTAPVSAARQQPAPSSRRAPGA